jgi:hypothetical protein
MKLDALSLQEKVLYAQIVLLVAVVFFYAFFVRSAAPGTYPVHTIPLFVAFLFVCLRSRFRKSGDVFADERDERIEGIGARWSNILLAGGIGSILIMYCEHGRPDSVAHLIDILFYLLAASMALRIVRQLVAYRMAL